MPTQRIARRSQAAGDAFEDAPATLEVEIVPIRREFALSDVVAFVRLWRYFRRQHFAEALIDYGNRQRRFGSL